VEVYAIITTDGIDSTIAINGKEQKATLSPISGITWQGAEYSYSFINKKRNFEILVRRKDGSEFWEYWHWFEFTEDGFMGEF
jgi:hypothetical protein